MQREWSVKTIVITALVVFAAVIGITVLVKSINNIEPGHKGVIFYKWGSGVNVDNVYSEGLILISPWNELIVYDVRQKNVDMELKVLEKNGLEVGIDISILYNPMPLQIGNLHNQIGRDFENIVVIPRTRSAGREVTGQFDAEELYSTKRDELQTQIESVLMEKFGDNYITLVDVLIRDVNLPSVIKKAIENKQEQEQKNELAEKLEAEATSVANAAVAKSEGIKQSKILEAQGEAEAIKLKQAQLSKSPQYIEFIKVQAYASHGKSWYGENNIFGSNAVAVLKGLK